MASCCQLKSIDSRPSETQEVSLPPMVQSGASGTKRPLNDASGAAMGSDENDAEASGAAAGASAAPAPFVEVPWRGTHEKAVSAVAFAPAHQQSPWHGSRSVAAVCASASADGTVGMWRLTEDMMDPASWPASRKAAAAEKPKVLRAARTLSGHTRGINDVTFSCTAEYLATASDDKTLRVWDAATGSGLVEFKGHTNFVFSCAFSPQSNLLASGSFDETVKLWDVRSGDCVSTLPAHSDPVTGVDFNRDGTCIVSGSHDGLIRIWDTMTGECLKTIYAGGNPPVSFVRFSRNGKFVLSGTLDSTLRLWRVGDRPAGPAGAGGGATSAVAGGSALGGGGARCTKTYTGGHANSKFCIFSAFAVANPGRHSIVTGSEDGKVYLYDLQRRSVSQVLTGHTDSVLAVAAHDSREIFATGGMAEDCTVRFWVPGTSRSDS